MSRLLCGPTLKLPQHLEKLVHSYDDAEPQRKRMRTSLFHSMVASSSRIGGDLSITKQNEVQEYLLSEGITCGPIRATTFHSLPTDFDWESTGFIEHETPIGSVRLDNSTEMCMMYFLPEEQINLSRHYLSGEPIKHGPWWRSDAAREKRWTELCKLSQQQMEQCIEYMRIVSEQEDDDLIEEVFEADDTQVASSDDDVGQANYIVISDSEGEDEISSQPDVTKLDSPGITVPLQPPGSEDECYLCEGENDEAGTTVLCCDRCPRVCHPLCAIGTDDIPDSEETGNLWLCPHCEEEELELIDDSELNEEEIENTRRIFSKVRSAWNGVPVTETQSNPFSSESRNGGVIQSAMAEVVNNYDPTFEEITRAIEEQKGFKTTSLADAERQVLQRFSDEQAKQLLKQKIAREEQRIARKEAARILEAHTQNMQQTLAKQGEQVPTQNNSQESQSMTQAAPTQNGQILMDGRQTSSSSTKLIPTSSTNGVHAQSTYVTGNNVSVAKESMHSSLGNQTGTSGTVHNSTSTTLGNQTGNSGTASTSTTPGNQTGTSGTANSSTSTTPRNQTGTSGTANSSTSVTPGNQTGTSGTANSSTSVTMGNQSAITSSLPTPTAQSSANMVKPINILPTRRVTVSNTNQPRAEGSTAQPEKYFVDLTASMEASRNSGGVSKPTTKVQNSGPNDSQLNQSQNNITHATIVKEGKTEDKRVFQQQKESSAINTVTASETRLEFKLPKPDEKGTDADQGKPISSAESRQQFASQANTGTQNKTPVEKIAKVLQVNQTKASSEARSSGIVSGKADSSLLTERIAGAEANKSSNSSSELQKSNIIGSAITSDPNHIAKLNTEDDRSLMIEPTTVSGTQQSSNPSSLADTSLMIEPTTVSGTQQSSNPSSSADTSLMIEPNAAAETQQSSNLTRETDENLMIDPIEDELDWLNIPDETYTTSYAEPSQQTQGGSSTWNNTKQHKWSFSAPQRNESQSYRSGTSSNYSGGYRLLGEKLKHAEGTMINVHSNGRDEPSEVSIIGVVGPSDPPVSIDKSNIHATHGNPFILGRGSCVGDAWAMYTWCSAAEQPEMFFVNLKIIFLTLEVKVRMKLGVHHTVNREAIANKISELFPYMRDTALMITKIKDIDVTKITSLYNDLVRVKNNSIQRDNLIAVLGYVVGSALEKLRYLPKMSIAESARRLIYLRNLADNNVTIRSRAATPNFKVYSEGLKQILDHHTVNHVIRSALALCVERCRAKILQRIAN